MTDRHAPQRYAPHVRAHYEAYPFPNRDPADERRRLIVSEQHLLGKIDHFCFAGRRVIDAGFRVLVAGGGTGDQTVFLAEQLRGCGARVVYVDLSEASLEIARARAEARGLDNVEWHHGSILDVPSWGIGPFDLVSCTGVLHHLPEPEAGLAALRAVLAPDGAMSLMLYGRAGRMGVYAGQDLMRLVNDGVHEPAERVRNARAALGSLPPTHWLLRGGDRGALLGALLGDDANLYDLLLHEQDVAYSVPELHALLAGADLELVEFTHFLQDVPCFRYMYEPSVFISDPALRERVAALPRPVQQGIAEAMSCTITCHGFYAAPRAAGRVAMPNDPEMVPYFLYFDPSDLIARVRAAGAGDVSLPHRHSTVHFAPGRFSAALVAAVDGRRPLGELFAKVREETGATAPDEALWRDFMAFYVPLNRIDAIVLRHRSVPPFPEYAPVTSPA